MRFQSSFAPVSSTLAALFLSVAALAQEPSADPQTPPSDPKPAQTQPAGLSNDPSARDQQRILGVLPNYRTTHETGVFTPISAWPVDGVRYFTRWTA